MSEFKGTPGPWDFKKVKGEEEWFIFQKGSMKKLCGGTIRTPVAEELGNKNDAQLIAAAPELLEALQDALHAHDKHGEYSEWDFARQAIAKALGDKS